jgi:hypothetical protein
MSLRGDKVSLAVGNRVAHWEEPKDKGRITKIDPSRRTPVQVQWDDGERSWWDRIELVLVLTAAPVDLSIVRSAKREDRDEIWRLLRLGHAENGMFPLSVPKVDYFLDRVLHPETIPPLDQGPRGYIGVIGPIGALEAIVFVILGTFWYSDTFHLEECIVFVDPEHRKTAEDPRFIKAGHAQALISWMKNASDTLDITLFTGIVSNVRTEAKCRLYSRSLPKVGEFYLYQPHKA